MSVTGKTSFHAIIFVWRMKEHLWFVGSELSENVTPESQAHFFGALENERI